MTRIESAALTPRRRLIATAPPAPPAFFGPMPEDDYRARQRAGAIGGSALGAILSGSPAHVVARRSTAPSSAMTFGTATHARALEPSTYSARYRRAAAAYKTPVDYRKHDDGWIAVAADGSRGPFATSTEARRVAGEWRVDGAVDADGGVAWYRTRKDADAATATDGDDRIVLTASDADRIELIAAALARHPVASCLLGGGDVDAEVAMFWRDAATGVDCSGKCDAIDTGRGVLVDLKTHGRVMAPARAARWIADSYYHVQMAHYAAGVRAAGHTVARVYLVAVETVEPFAVGVYQLSDHTLAVGEHLRREALARWRDADLAAPPYGVDPTVVDLPTWAIPPGFDADAFDRWSAQASIAAAVDRAQVAIEAGDYSAARDELAMAAGLS